MMQQERERERERERRRTREKESGPMGPSSCSSIQRAVIIIL